MRQAPVEHPLLPVARQHLTVLQLRERFALQALREGRATDAELGVLRTSCRVALALAEDGYGAEHATTLLAAEAGLKTDVPAAVAVADALDVHDMQRAVAPLRRYIAALDRAATAA